MTVRELDLKNLFPCWPSLSWW